MLSNVFLSILIYEINSFNVCLCFLVPGPDVAMYGALSAVPINNPKIGFKYEGNTEWIFLVMFSF